MENELDGCCRDEIAAFNENRRLKDFPERSPREIETQVLAVSQRSTVDELAAALEAAEWLLCRARSIHHLLKEIAIAWIDRNGEFDIGNVHYSVGFSLTTKCLHPQECGQTLMRVLKGDFDAYMQALVAQPYKPGTVKRMLDKRTYNTLFMSKRAGRLINGVPERIIKRADKAFLPNSGHS